MSDLYLLGYVVLGGLLCFWPNSSNHLLTNSILEELSIDDDETVGISYFMIALAIPFAINAILDAWNNVFKERKEPEIFLTFFEKMLLSVAFVATPAYSIYAASESFNGITDLNVFMLKRFLPMLVVGTTWASLTRLYRTYFPRVLFYIGFGCICVGLLTALIPDVCDMHFYPVYVVRLSLIFKMVGILIFLCLMFHWIVRTSINAWRSTTVLSSSEMSWDLPSVSNGIYFHMFCEFSHHGLSECYFQFGHTVRIRGI